MAGSNTYSELKKLLCDSCKQDPDLMMDVIDEYVGRLSDSELDKLEDFLVNNFGED
jgi:hypothetical protein